MFSLCEHSEILSQWDLVQREDDQQSWDLGVVIYESIKTNIFCFSCCFFFSSCPYAFLPFVSAGREWREPARLLLRARPSGWPPPGELATRSPLRQPAAPREDPGAGGRNGEAGAVVLLTGFSGSRKGRSVLLSIHSREGRTFRSC